ncbi:hypothetical protein ACVW1C_007513 [Bradyrhizobium sp. USDA 4011]
MGKKLTVIPPAAPPAPSSPWPSAKQLKVLGDKLDTLDFYFRRMWDVAERLGELRREGERLPTPDELALARNCIVEYEQSAVRAALLNGDLARMHDERVPADWWSDDEVRESAIARFVTILIASFPNGVKDPEVFVPQMIEDVVEWAPHFFSMQDAARELRNTQTFAPSTAELKQAYDTAMTKWQARWDAENCAETTREELLREIAMAEARIADAERRQKYFEAKRAPLAVGDRVRHRQHGPGVIVAHPDKLNVCWVWWDALDRSWLVRFDGDADPQCVWAGDLEKLVEGDEGFAPSSEE